jgi:Tol biopolymer transport system component
MLKKILGSLTIAAAVLGAASLLASDAAGEMKLQQAINMVEKRDFARAIPLLDEVSKSSDRSLAARALLYKADVQQRQGHESARATYERIIKDFGNTEAAKEAGKRLNALGAAAQSGVGSLLVCAVCNDRNPYPFFISGDGRFMFTTDWDSGDLAVRDLANNGRLTRLMAKSGTWDTSDEYAEWAMPSPDAKRVAFLWDTGRPIKREVNGIIGTGTIYQLRVMPNTPGAAHTEILTLDGEYRWAAPGVWFDNNSFLVQLEKETDGTWVLARVSANGPIKPIISLQWRLQGVRSQPSVSPDGRYIAYAALAVNPGKKPAPNQPLDSADQYIYVLPADGSGSERPVAKSPGVNESPLWTEDGAHIVFLSNRSQGSRTGSFGLWSVEVRNGQAVGAPDPLDVPLNGRIRPVGITRSGAYYYLPERSGAGSDVFVADLRPGTYSLAGTPKRLTEISANANSSPAWSPDGQRVAFKRRRQGPLNSAGFGTVVYDLVVYSMVTQEEVVVSSNPYNLPPVWFHDGNSILSDVLRVDLKTRQSKSIEATTHTAVPMGVNAASPRVLSADDKTLYLATFDPKDKMASVVAWDLITGEQRRVWSFASPNADGIGGLALSPDGQSLAMKIGRGDGWRLARISIDGTDYREISYSGSVSKGFFAWTIAGLFFTSNTNHIMRISAEGGRAESTGLDAYQSLQLSPDGRRIVFSDSTGEKGLWVLNNLSSLWKAAR